MTPAPSGTCYITYVAADARSTTAQHRLKLHFADERGSHSVLIRPDATGMATLVQILQERQRVREPKIGTNAAPTQAQLDNFAAKLTKQADTISAERKVIRDAETEAAMALLQELCFGE